MIAFPALSALISLICAGVIARDAVRRPRPDKVAWAIAFALFAIAAGAEVAGSGALLGWSANLARVYYLAGAILVVGFLALGELYLLAPKRIAAVAPGSALLVTALAVTLVWAAPVETDRLADDGWDALERGPALIVLAASVNGLGTLVIVGGLGISAWRFWRRGIQRNRMIGCLLIAAGTLIVATGGTLTRFGQREYLYLAMSLGVAVIFTGYLWTRRPGAVSAAASVGAIGTAERTAVPSPTLAPSLAAPTPAGIVSLLTRRVEQGTAPGLNRGAEDGALDPAVVFLERRLLPLDDPALDAACAGWSVERDGRDRLDRAEATRAWALRLRLTPSGQDAFDRHGVPARRQLAELYHEVLAPGVADWDPHRSGQAIAGRG